MSDALQMLKNTELIQFIAKHPNDRNGWNEFHRRFDKFLNFMLCQICRKYDDYTGYRMQMSVEDFKQEVYIKLVQNNLKALVEFEGKKEKSIYAYLIIIAQNVVKNHVDALNTLKRQAVTVSINADKNDTNQSDSFFLVEQLKSLIFDTELIINHFYLVEEVDDILAKITKGQNKERDCMFFRLAVFHDLTSEEIVNLFSEQLNGKTVGNIVSDLKQKMRVELLKRFGKIN